MRINRAVLALAVTCAAALGASAAMCNGVEGVEGDAWMPVATNSSDVVQLARSAAAQYAQELATQQGLTCQPSLAGLAVDVAAACRSDAASPPAYALDFNLRMPCLDASGALVGVIQEGLTAELDQAAGGDGAGN